MPKIAFTIVVPFRDENENLPLLLASIAKMKYPLDLITLLLVDDSSNEKFKIPFDNLQVSIITSEFLIHPRKTLSRPLFLT
jgi:glycosyltransferase involved in cell wall biosynthesis